MKKLMLILAVLMCLNISITAYAQSEPEADPAAQINANTNTGTGENVDDILVDDVLPETEDNTRPIGENKKLSWEEYYAQTVQPYGYPDDVGGVYYDKNTGMLCMLVVNPSPERIEELRAQFDNEEFLRQSGAGSGLAFTPCKYSYVELARVQYEIYTLMGDGSKIFGTGIGWHDASSDTPGFGESGKEFRVTVSVDESVLSKYHTDFTNMYGDKVFVTANGEGVADDAGMNALVFEGGNKNGFNTWIWAVGGIFILGMAVILYANRTRLIPAFQTNNGNVVTGNTPASTKQTVAAIKNSALTPSDDVFKNIMEKVNNTKK